MTKKNGKAGKNGTAKPGPAKMPANGKDPVTGQFLPGHPGGPGRPKGIDYRRAVEAYCKAHDVDLEEGIGAATVTMMREAIAGDTTAFKLLCDRNCGLLKQEVDVTSDGKSMALPVVIPTGEKLDEWMQAYDDLREELKNGRGGGRT